MGKMSFYTTSCGLAMQNTSKNIFYFFSLLEIIGVILAISLTDKTQIKNIGYGWLSITLLRGVLLLGAIIQFLFQLYKVGTCAFKTFSFWRTIFVVISNLTYTVFFLTLATDQAAFNLTPDLKTGTSVQRLEYLIGSLHTAMSLISGVGYTDITPKIWYARLIVLPYFLFVFVIQGTIFVAFNEFANDQIKKSRGYSAGSYEVFDNFDAPVVRRLNH